MNNTMKQNKNVFYIENMRKMKSASNIAQTDKHSVWGREVMNYTMMKIGKLFFTDDMRKMKSVSNITQTDKHSVWGYIIMKKGTITLAETNARFHRIGRAWHMAGGAI